jgi:glycogen debranching enzyme
VKLPGVLSLIPLRTETVLLALLTALTASAGAAQQSGQIRSVAELRVPRFPIAPDPVAPGSLSLSGTAREGEYMGVTGSRAAWLGFETGAGEVWVHPLKIAREVEISFEIPQYADPIPGASLARNVEVKPGAAVVHYSHAAFQVRQHILAPRDLPGILILLDVDAVVDLRIRVEFQPVLQEAWPGGFGGQYLYWDETDRAFVLSESLQRRNAVIGSPWAEEASAHPAHRLGEAPSTFILPVDPDRAREEFIPIVITGGMASRQEVLATYRHAILNARNLHEENQAWAESLERDYTSAESAGPPDAFDLRQGLEWAKVNLAEQRVCNPQLGCGLVAGWGPSGTSFRPGFGWFFGGDAAINSLAMDVTGQWTEAAEGLRFLARYQRDDGKIPHEISQAAGDLPWFEDFPYAYYHADTTPFWILAVWSYWRASGDDDFLRELWPALQKAYAWCLSVETDGDGIIENTSGGLGAIEVGGLGEGIHQDIYLAGAWVTALGGIAEMARAMGEVSLPEEAGSLRELAETTLNRRYWREREGHHAFGILRGGGTNDNLTAWPGTALAFGLLSPREAEGTLRHLATDAISSEWGARLLSTESDLFDPLHYNNGAVWPFMTGFVAWGQYRYRRPWAGYLLLRALFDLTDRWSLGRHPENLSGAFYQTMDATVPHQFFASSMLATSFLRGLLGWEPDAPRRRAKLSPQPPPTWPTFSVQGLRAGQSRLEFRQTLDLGEATVAFTLEGPPLELRYVQAIPLGARNVQMEGSVGTPEGFLRTGIHDLQYEVVFQLSEETPAELQFRWDGGLELLPPPGRPEPGGASGGIRILDFTREGDDWILVVEGDGGTTQTVRLRGERIVTAEGQVEEMDGAPGITLLTLRFPDTGGRVVRQIRLTQAR